MSPDQITRNAAAIAGAVKMLEREIASFQDQLSVSASTDETRRQISDYLTELHFHFRTLCSRAIGRELLRQALAGFGDDSLEEVVHFVTPSVSEGPGGAGGAPPIRPGSSRSE